MESETKILILHAETPLHPGTGSDTGALDLPLLRERVSGFPLVSAATLKGVLRVEAQHRKLEPQEIDRLFGSESKGGAHGQAAALSVSDARILFFPVRSASGVFTWVTCPQVLARLKRDLSLDGKTDFALPDFTGLQSGRALTVPSCPLLVGQYAILEEFRLDCVEAEDVGNTAAWLAEAFVPARGDFHFWHEKLKSCLMIVSDEDFCDFVNFATEVSARLELDQERRYGDAENVRYEEYLPAESILYSVVVPLKANDSSALATLDKLSLKVLRIGANQSIGKGLCRASWLTPPALPMPSPAPQTAPA